MMLWNDYRTWPFSLPSRDPFFVVLKQVIKEFKGVDKDPAKIYKEARKRLEDTGYEILLSSELMCLPGGVHDHTPSSVIQETAKNPPTRRQMMPYLRRPLFAVQRHEEKAKNQAERMGTHTSQEELDEGGDSDTAVNALQSKIRTIETKHAKELQERDLVIEAKDSLTAAKDAIIAEPEEKLQRLNKTFSRHRKTHPDPFLPPNSTFFSAKAPETPLSQLIPASIPLHPPTTKHLKMNEDTNQGNGEGQGENSGLGNTGRFCTWVGRTLLTLMAGSSQVNERIPAAPQGSMGNTPSTGSVPIQHARQVINNNLDALEASSSRPGDHLIYKHQVVNLSSFAPRRWMMPPEERRWRPLSWELTGTSKKREARRAKHEEEMRKEKEEAEAAAAAAAHTQVDNVNDPILVLDRPSDVSAAQGDDGQQAIAHPNKKRKHNEHSRNSKERRQLPAAANVESSGRELDEELDVGLMRVLNPALKAAKEKYQAIADKLKVSERKRDDLQKVNMGMTQNQAKQARIIAELSQRVAEQAGDIADLTEKTVTLKASQCF
ncbi:hypothetical protein CFIO01_07021 [Colletotrichum fioriniae PJ7]|uniref:Uncharacterized protein n=1 Tax=Colletotrichum fioriniae PJ7 TaxID=1445577 RepID=A0A010R302_9PEZI|nr:hypothetical protein CFIO01_07021 [Colletotrichum fioriniae PJ7]